MGDHGLFVWSAYALTLAAIAAEVLWLRRRRAHGRRDHSAALADARDSER